MHASYLGQIQGHSSQRIFVVVVCWVMILLMDWKTIDSDMRKAMVIENVNSCIKNYSQLFGID